MLEVDRTGAKVHDADYLLSRAEVERMGRWVSFGRAAALAVVLGLLTLPLSLVAFEDLDNRAEGSGLSLSDISRIALISETVLLGAVILCGFRGLELVGSSRAPGRLVRAGRGLFWMLFAVVVVDAIENIALWTAHEGLAREWTAEFNLVIALAVTSLLLSSSALALVSSPGFWWRRRAGDHAGTRFRRPDGIVGIPVTWLVRWGTGLGGDELATAIRRWRSGLERSEQVLAEPPTPKGTVICCSGGGIRSSSFCLGGLQTLSERGVYDRASAVVGVSGGGYIGAAYHVMRWRSGSDGWGPLDPPAYDAHSPEVRWLRRHSRYLLESARVATLGFLSLLYGISVNLVWLVLVLAATAGWLALFFQISGGLRGLGTTSATGADYTDEWQWVTWVPLLAAVGAVIFVVERLTDRFRTISHTSRERSHTVAVYLLWLGLVVSLALLVLPQSIAAVHNWAVRSDGVLAGLAYQVGLVPAEACNLRLPSEDACGVSATERGAPSSLVLPASLGTLAATVIAVVQAARARVRGDVQRARLEASVVNVWRKVREIVVPWGAAAVVGMVVLALLWRWIASLVRDPTPFGEWRVGLAFAVLLVLLRVLTDANHTSLHHFYRERLSYAYLLTRQRQRALPLRYRQAVRFSESAPPQGHGPELVSCAVANISDTAYVPTDRHCTPFVFDANGMGLTDTSLPSGPCRTASVIYERAADNGARNATLSAAMAISGAAVSPLVGRNKARVGPYRVILALGNARLGVWLPNPLWVDDVAETRLLIRRRLPESRQAFDRLSDTDQQALLRSLKPLDLAWWEACCWRAYRDLSPGERRRHDDRLARNERVAWLSTVSRHDHATYVARDRGRRDGFRERLTVAELRRLDVLMARTVQREYLASPPEERHSYLAALSVSERGRLEITLVDEVARGKGSAPSLLTTEATTLLERRRADHLLCEQYEAWSPSRRRAERQKLTPERYAQLTARLDTMRIARLMAMGPDERSAHLASCSTEQAALLSVQQVAATDGAPLTVPEGIHFSVRVALAWREVAGKPGPFRLAKEAFGRTSLLDRWLYVTDGGHYDNLGLVEALRRRPAEIIVLDASGDAEDSFRALADAVATARIDLGVELDLPLTRLIRKDKDFADAAWTSGQAAYPDGGTARVHLVKVVMVDSLPWDTQSYKRSNPDFPRTSTGRQLYGEFDLEAYRILGREVTARLLDDLERPKGDIPSVRIADPRRQGSPRPAIDESTVRRSAERGPASS